MTFFNSIAGIGILGLNHLSLMRALKCGATFFDTAKAYGNEGAILAAIKDSDVPFTEDV